MRLREDIAAMKSAVALVEIESKVLKIAVSVVGRGGQGASLIRTVWWLCVREKRGEKYEKCACDKYRMICAICASLSLQKLQH